ncbi:hypothetical protein [Candidatus Sulfurimonas baltica]|uniref:Uncharacterized protein n=1 Tax=Candidatus Sulfurimonas baltica TaxID=2740404 RepID=A0A7S7LTF3_9BACT|nr:hypothetical protein [Candidatus Sulfurimonas baltica]QOY50945.1 hypothetical protein HUE88_07250 [Candidatus Sulfurimonas baltica]
MLIYAKIDEFIQSNRILDTELAIHTDYDDQQIHEILSNCNLEGSSWDSLDYHTQIYKTYDEDGNSEWMTALFIDTTDKKINDLVSLSAIIQEAEDKFYEFDNDDEYFDD